MKGTMFMRTTLERTEIEKCPLEKGAGTGIHEMNEKDTVNSTEPAATLIGSDERRTAVSKPFKSDGLFVIYL